MVTLRRMSAAEFATWWDITIRSHAEQLSRATGHPLAAELDAARELLPQVLVDGVDTSGMHFFAVEAAHERVGWLWIGAAPGDQPAGFVWDIIIDDAARGRGHGRATMVAAEQFFVEQGMARITLQVATGNDVARRLYESLGYEVVTTNGPMTTMAKALPSG